MSKGGVQKGIGLMSGTSLDGVDAALIETDGAGYVRPVEFLCLPYTDEERAAIRACLGRRDVDAPEIRAASDRLTRKHGEAVHALLDKAAMTPGQVDLIGFHGQTLYHAPEEGVTIQIGDGDLLARLCGIDVMDDFRTRDVEAGGQGAPLAPAYHRARALSDGLDLPCVILNIGGVANVTWIGGDADDLLAFDTGPGNALMDDLVFRRTGELFDQDGAYAAAGRADTGLVQSWLSHPYFSKKPPKSLDRNEWDIAAFGPLGAGLQDLSTEDALATLQAFTVEGIARSRAHMPFPPGAWYVCGGGRHNTALMGALHVRLNEDARESVAVEKVDTLGWNGDATEAECFAYLAQRSKLGYPLSWPGTTGIPEPLCGGRIHTHKTHSNQ